MDMNLSHLTKPFLKSTGSIFLPQDINALQLAFRSITYHGFELKSKDLFAFTKAALSQHYHTSGEVDVYGWILS